MTTRLLRSTLAAFSIASVVIGARSAQAAGPTVGDCLSANESSIKLRNDHKLNASRTQLLVCAAASCPAEIRDACTRRLVDVNAAIPTIVFEAKDPAGNDLGAVVVTMDGAPLVDRLDGTALPLDPGEHSFSFEVLGQPKVEKHLLLHEGEKERREPVIIGAVAPEPTPEPTVPIAAPETPAAPPAKVQAPPVTAAPFAPVSPVPVSLAPNSAPPQDDGSSQTAGYIVAGLGVTSLVVGSVFGFEALSSKKSSDAECPEDNRCSAAGVESYNTAKTQAWVADVGVGLGLVGIGLGAYLVLKSPGSDATHGAAPGNARVERFRFIPQLAPGQARLDIRGAW